MQNLVIKNQFIFAKGIIYKKLQSLFLILVVLSFASNIAVCWTIAIVGDLSALPSSIKRLWHCENEDLQFQVFNSLGSGSQRIWFQATVFFGGRDFVQYDPKYVLDSFSIEDCVKESPATDNSTKTVGFSVPDWCESYVANLTAPIIEGGSSCYKLTIADAYGWPVVAMSQRYDYQGAVLGFQPPKELNIVLTSPVKRKDITVPNTLPVQPIWSGMLVNTICYFMMCVTAIVSIQLAIILWRYRANRCMQCGYSLVGIGDHRCPECGGG